MITAVELAERMKAEILQDVKAGIVPSTVSEFAELHDFVDANCYGGLKAYWMNWMQPCLTPTKGTPPPWPHSAN